MFKIIPELANFVLTYRNKTLDIKLGQFNFHFHEKTNGERIITVSHASNPDYFVSFFVHDETNGDVVFADNMTPKERQSLYSKVRAFVKKNYISLPKTQYKVNRFCVFCETEILYTIRNKKKINIAVVAERRGVYHILHDPDVDVMRFVSTMDDGSMDDGKENEREHKIEDNFDIVENMTNTDENNHGGNSKANEVEGARRGDGSIDSDSVSVGGGDGVSVSTASAPDTADDTAGDDTADGFQDARGGFGGDPQNSHPADASASCETADSERNGGVGSIGARVDTEDAQEESIGGEGGPQPLVVEEEEDEEESVGDSVSDGGSVGDGDDPKSLVEAFLEQREFNKPYRGEGLDIDTELFVKGKTLDDRVVRRLTTTFRKHFVVSSLGRETPALDKKLLIKRLVSFRSPYTAFKRDLANQTILVLVDTSPSMSNFTPLMPYFWKITKLLKDLIVIENTNMIPVRIYENGRMKTLGDTEFDRYMNEEQAVGFYNDFMRKHDISTIVNFTDFDGLDITELLLEKTNAEMIILDVYKCRVLNYMPRKAKNWEGLPSKLYKYRDRISYWYGVGDFWGVVKVLNEEL